MLIRTMGLLVLLDGGLSACLGHSFLRWLKSCTPGPLHAFITPFEQVPESAFRAGALLEAAAGAHLLVRGTLPGQSGSTQAQS